MLVSRNLRATAARLRLPLRPISTRLPLRASSTRLYSAVPKTLKPAAFSLPKETPSTLTVEQQQHMSQELRPFELTRLAHGASELRIGITDAASNKLVAIAEGDNNADSALRVKVESGGCHGFQYNFELTTLQAELAKDPELVVFERTDTDKAKVVFDEASLEILQDSKIDYTNELIGSSFQMVDSPYTSTSCGCGASFDFDFEKLEQAKAKQA